MDHRGAINAAYSALSDDIRHDLSTMVAIGRGPMIALSRYVLPVPFPGGGCQSILDRSKAYLSAGNVEGEEESYRTKEAVPPTRRGPMPALKL